MTMAGIPRTSFLGSHRATQQRLALAFNRFSDANNRVATGRSFTKPSEDPSAASRASLLQDQLDQLDGFKAAIDDGTARLAVSDTRLQQAMDLYHRATELATQAASSLTRGEARLSVRSEILTLRDELVGIANAKYLGAGLFSGGLDVEAVEYDSGTSSWTIVGSPADTIDRRVGQAETVRVNITAAEAFQGAGTDVFTVLDELATALETNDEAGIRDALDTMPALRAQLGAAMAQVGAAAGRIQKAADRNSGIALTITTELSMVRDVDLAEAVTDQQRMASAYQAALGATAKSFGMSLMDFLR
jgi:flagellar hook-associated protein 3 FlgL